MHADHLGAARKITDGARALAWDLVAGPYGEFEDVTGSLVYNPRLPGQYADAETGYRYNLMRDYDASLGRYLQSDPIGLDGGLNTYAYVGDNPVNRIDPSGEFLVVIPVLVPTVAQFIIDSIVLGFGLSMIIDGPDDPNSPQSGGQCEDDGDNVHATNNTCGI